ncbi:hypothetical protein B0T11DRAFT_114632 [Plectosphaerella cucumerina]|uniref:Transmembrane protein n=1 Tax=Plectosphaerella cucumerina TaxID=40658 RepID=A0A8K0TFR5_9PEZI|nr:hypothetical protein B0T11DRAFT_114632 [Plectosphaerella cucumerina]
MSSRTEAYIPYLAAPVLALPFLFYLCYRAFKPAGKDAAAARRWVLWTKIAVPLIMIGALFEMILTCVQLASYYGSELRLASRVGTVLQSHGVVALFLSLADAAHWLAALRNNGVPVRNSGWARILAYVVAGTLSVFTFAVFGLWVDSFYRYGISNAYGDMYLSIISLTIQSMLSAIGITMIGLGIALRFKTRDNAILVSASKHLLAASVLFLVPFLWVILTYIIQMTVMNWYNTRWVFTVQVFLYWLPLTACLFTLNLLRARCIGTEHSSKERSQSV